MEFDKVIDRIKAILEKESGRKILDKEIAKLIEISPSQYSTMKQKNKIPIEKIVNYCALNKISINWILFGQSIDMLDSDSENIFRIKFLSNISGSAGGGAINYDNTDYTYITLDKVYMELLGIGSLKYIEAIRVSGDSMEPTITDNAIAVIDRSKTDIKQGGIFVVNTVAGTFIKRVTTNPQGGVDLISDNKIYPIQTINEDEGTIVGKVIGTLEKT